MKKAIRILIPIFLAIAIVLCMAWYLLIYDRDFTRDLLLAGARFFEDQGNHSISLWLYDIAYHQAEHNDEVAIELAEQYIADGNYTRAEYTLTSAIADGGGVDLYVNLCRTYVMQDKLLDAVQFLNKIADPQIKAQLDQMRPAAPEVTPTPGIYNQYFNVTVTTKQGSLYVSTDQQIPSIETDLYTTPIPLTAGENTIYALSVDRNGLVSPLAIFGYTLGGIIEEVQFSDSAVEAQIRKTLGVAADVVLFTSDLWSITEFTVPAEAKSLEDLKHLTYLRALKISGAAADQLGFLAACPQLQTLEIINTPVNAQELESIGKLTQLQRLTLSGCGLTSISSLSGISSLIDLDLHDNTIQDLSPLSSLQGLQSLQLQHNAITDLKPLSVLISLRKLDISYNAVKELAPLSALSAITFLDASNNLISSLPQMEALGALSQLDLSYNSLGDISALQTCTKLTYLNVSNNALSDISIVSSMEKLQELYFSYNKVSQLPAFPSESGLVLIDGSHNQLSDLKPLDGLAQLNQVYMDYNAQISSVDCLAKCPVLFKVYVYGTKVSDVSSLTSQSILVYYDPT